MKNQLHSALIATSLLCTTPLLAESLPDLEEPEGEVILTITGQIENANADDGSAQFDLAMLDALPKVEFTTSNIWYEDPLHFEGVELKTLMELVGATGENIYAEAIDDYAIDLPMSDAVDGGALLAFRVDGEEISVRDKGPIWIIYNFDENTDYQTEVYYSRSVWQLKHLDIQETAAE